MGFLSPFFKLFALLTSGTIFVNDDTSFVKNAGIWTPYVGNLDTRSPIGAGCTCKKLWMVMNTGTLDSEPENKMIFIRNELVANNEIVSKTLNEATIERFRQWTANNLGEVLADRGTKEIDGIARRTKKRFPELLDVSYDESEFKFASNDAPYDETMEVFMMGLFDGIDPERVRSEHTGDTEIFKSVAIYESLKDEKHDIEERFREEMNVSHDSPLNLDDEIARIADSLDISLDVDDAIEIYRTYSQETAANPDTESVWKYAISSEAMRMMEYIVDSELYDQYGPRYERNSNMACHIFKAILDLFEKDELPTKTVFYFDVPWLSFSMLTFLDFFKDEGPLYMNSIREDRKWRMSKLGGYGTNLLVGLSQCSNNVLHVFLMHQERRLSMPGCPEPCTLEAFRKSVEKRISDEQCKEVT